LHGKQPEEGGERGEDDRAEALDAGGANGIVNIQPLSFSFVGEVDENERVVHDYAGEGDDSKEAEQAEAVAHQQMADDGSDNSKRDTDHDDHGLGVALEGDGEQNIDEYQSGEQTRNESANTFALVGLFPFEGEGESAIFLGQFLGRMSLVNAVSTCGVLSLGFTSAKTVTVRFPSRRLMVV